MTATDTISTYVVPALNTLGAATAVVYRVRAALRGRPGWAARHLAIAGLALFYVVAYAALWSGWATDRVAWSQAVAPVAIGTWWVVWIAPARRSVREEHP